MRLKKYRPTKREQGIFITRKVGDPIPTAQAQGLALKSLLAQPTDYEPTVRDQRARAYYGLVDEQAITKALEHALSLQQQRGQYKDRAKV